MFGSDWPVCLLAGTYDEVIEIIEETIPKDYQSFIEETIPKDYQSLLFGENGRVFYKIH